MPLRLCSSEYLDAELDFLHACLLRNGYPSDFINKHKVTVFEPKPMVHTAKQKKLFLCVPFYGDKAANNLN